MPAVSPRQLLKVIDQIEISELRPFVSEVLARASQRLAPSLSIEETALLLKINRGLPASVEERRRQLDAKRRAETLSAAEHEEFLRLIDQIESAQVERVAHLIELAGLRGMSLPSLMTDLGLEPPPIE
ncbi:MAG: STAS/SEC14 domain-containing protein [Acidobacteriota bacterium]